MTKRPEPNRHVMLNLFQHLVCFFLLSAEAPENPVHRTGFSGAILINPPTPNSISALQPRPAQGQIGQFLLFPKSNPTDLSLPPGHLDQVLLNGTLPFQENIFLIQMSCEVRIIL